MSVQLTIEAKTDQLEADLRKFMAGLNDKTALNRSVADRATELTRNYLTAIAQSRHATATSLGASPSGHWAQAAEKTSGSADSDAAKITIAQPGIGRALHDVTIIPTGGKKYLTIPAVAAAYAKRAPTVPDLVPIIRTIGGTRRAVALGKKSSVKGVPPTIWYWLVKSVTQKQDRSLLPSDEQYRLAALEGAREYLDKLLGK
jgi:hypothetical protein